LGQDVVVMMMSDNTLSGPRDARMDSTIPALARDAAKDGDTIQQPLAQTNTETWQRGSAERYDPPDSTSRDDTVARNDSYGSPPQATFLRRASSDTDRRSQDAYRRLSTLTSQYDDAPPLTPAQLDERREFIRQATTTLFTGGSAHFASGPMRARSPEQPDETPVSPTGGAGAWRDLPAIPAFHPMALLR